MYVKTTTVNIWSPVHSSSDLPASYLPWRSIYQGQTLSQRFFRLFLARFIFYLVFIESFDLTCHNRFPNGLGKLDVDCSQIIVVSGHLYF